MHRQRTVLYQISTYVIVCASVALVLLFLQEEDSAVR